MALNTLVLSPTSILKMYMHGLVEYVEYVRRPTLRVRAIYFVDMDQCVMFCATTGAGNGNS